MINKQSPEEFFKYYQDRGMKKWGGFHLSEHTASIKQEKKEKQVIILPKCRMTTDEIEQLLALSLKKNKCIAIQKEEVDINGHYQTDVVGQIKGQSSAGIFIEEELIEYDSIRHVEIVETSKWHQG